MQARMGHERSNSRPRDQLDQVHRCPTRIPVSIASELAASALTLSRIEIGRTQLRDAPFHAESGVTTFPESGCLVDTRLGVTGLHVTGLYRITTFSVVILLQC